MKLQKAITNKYKNKDYFKRWVVIPSKHLKLLDWSDDQELTAEVVDGKLVIEKKT